MSLPAYALVSPVRNEAKYIEKTLDSVVSQTHAPVRWVIVSDGSTDETDAIVSDYARQYPFIELVRRETESTREFGSKVHAIRMGIERLNGVEYGFLGNLDGDIAFDAGYFAELIRRMESKPDIGIAGGIICELSSGSWRPQTISTSRSVAGAVQFFRRECFNKIEGYRPLPFGGIDAVAENMARMHGWRVQTFSDLPVKHFRPVGTEGSSIYRARFNLGRREYVIGYHPVFGVVRAVSQMREAPYVIGGLCYFTGFFNAAMRRTPIALPDDFVRYLRREQIHRLGALVGFTNKP